MLIDNNEQNVDIIVIDRSPTPPYIQRAKHGVCRYFSSRGRGMGFQTHNKTGWMQEGYAKGRKASKTFGRKTRPITNLRRSNKSFLLPDFGKLLFSSSTFKSTTRSEEIGFPPTNNSRLSAILTEYIK